MQQEFTEIFENLRDLTASFVETQVDFFEYMEEEDEIEESKFYKELRKKMENLKIHENAIGKIRKSIDDKINEHYKDSDAKYKSDKRKLVELQLERERIELNKLKFGQ